MSIISWKRTSCNVYITEKDDIIAKQDRELKEKDNIIAEKDRELKEKNDELLAKNGEYANLYSKQFEIEQEDIEKSKNNYIFLMNKSYLHHLITVFS